MLATILLAATLTVTDYATMPQLSSPLWAPDGRRIAYVLATADLEKSAYDSDVWIIDATGANDRRLTWGEGTDNRPRWSPDGRQIAFLSDRSGRTAIHLIGVDGGEARQLTSEPTAIREFEWSPDGKSIAFTRVEDASAEDASRVKQKDDARVVGEVRHAHLHVLDVATGTARRITSGDRSVLRFDWAPDGSRIVIDSAPGTSLDALYRTDLYLVRVADGATTPLVVRPGLDARPSFSPDGKWVAFTSTGPGEPWLSEHGLEIVPAGGGEPRRISGEYGRTPDSIVWSGDSQAIYAESPWNMATQILRFDLAGRMSRLTKDEALHLDPAVRDGHAAYVFESLTSPPELYVDGRRLTSHNAAYRDRELGRTTVIRWKNPKDGLEIEGLLTLPVGHRPGTRVPLLTFVHGGPASRFHFGYLGYLGFLYPPHALAAEGFAVLRPNPRGTGGYGVAFRRANRNDWGGMDWLDIEAGIDKVIADGIADPERLGLMGWSYGGFMTAWGSAHSDRFRALSVGAPVVDLVSFHGTTDIRDFIPSYFPGRQLDLLRARSPLWQLRKTGAQVLIQHGEADDRVPFSQGTMLYRAFDELGVDVTMVAYPRTPHIPREPKLRIDVARRNVEFFRKHVGVN